MSVGSCSCVCISLLVCICPVFDGVFAAVVGRLQRQLDGKPQSLVLDSCELQAWLAGCALAASALPPVGALGGLQGVRAVPWRDILR